MGFRVQSENWVTYFFFNLDILSNAFGVQNLFLLAASIIISPKGFPADKLEDYIESDFFRYTEFWRKKVNPSAASL
jgi:hypothetical protein